MTLTAGSSLGPYEILERLGAGGMGEVYRARDTRLDRTVAVKVLLPQEAPDSGLRDRLEREGRTLAGLSHPHICTLHDVGHQDGVDYLVMEYLEGETLTSRLKRGPLAPAEVVRLGIEASDALDAAHRKGIVHRDLKPGNLMLTPTGVKLLDFGLARAMARAPLGDGSAVVTRSEPLTAEGTLVGTLPYMAPEQLEGREADSRSDVFALGAVLHEAATGMRVFQGDSQAGVIAAVIGAEVPSLTANAPDTPAGLDRAVRRCLAKDPEERWQSVRDLLLELRWISEEDAPVDEQAATVRRARWREPLAWLLAAAGIVMAVASFWLGGPETRQNLPVARLSLPLPPDATRAFSAVAPDGRQIAFSALAAGERRIWLRPLDGTAAHALPGTEGGTSPFWSPEGGFLAFFADGQLKRIGVEGGPPRVLCEAPGAFATGTWGADGTILFSVLEAPGGATVQRVPAAGGEPRPVPLRDEEGQELRGVWPAFLPDGGAFLLVCGGMTEDDRAEPAICAAHLDGRPARKLIVARPNAWASVSRPLFAPPDFLLHTRDGTLVAQRFDPDTWQLRGEPRSVADGVEHYGPAGLDHFSVSENGVLVYGSSGGGARLVWKDRDGRVAGEVGPPTAHYLDLNLAPGGDRAAVTLVDLRSASTDIWLIDLERDVLSRFTLEPGDDEMNPLWSPDGRRLVYSASRGASPFLHIKASEGGREEVLVPSTGGLQAAFDWTPDGETLVFGIREATTGWDLWSLPMEPPGEPQPLLQTRFNEMYADLSPDGRWMAYASDESGRMEVYVQPFPGPGGRQRISTDGGGQPRWRPDGAELFYTSLDDRLMAVPIDRNAGFRPGLPVELFTIDADPEMYRTYDIHPEGERFLVGATTSGPAGLTVLVDWTRLLER